MAYRIKLVRYEVQNVNHFYYGTYRMRVEVEQVEGEGLDPYIFVYKRPPASPYVDTTPDDFIAVAGPPQMADIPIAEPDPQKSWPFFRLDYIELDFAAQSLALDLWEKIQEEARVLCEAMGRYTQLVVAEEIWLPDIPETDESVSVSESVSQSLSASQSGA